MANRLSGILEERPRNRLSGLLEPVVVPDPKREEQRIKDVVDFSYDVGVDLSVSNQHWRWLTGDSRSVGIPFPEPTQPESPVNKKPEGDSTFGGQLVGGTIEMAAGLVDFPRTVLRNIDKTQSKFDFNLPGKAGRVQKLRQVYAAAKSLSERAQRGKDFLLQQHPEWRADPPESLVDIYKNPKKFGKGLVRAVPLLTAAGFSVAAGAPQAGMTIMFTSEKASAKENFIAREIQALEKTFPGTKIDTDSAIYPSIEEKADNASDVYGVVAAALEGLQVRQGLKLLGSARDIVLHRAAQKMAGKSLTKALATTAILEALEEMGQGTAEDVIGLAMLHQPIEGGAAGFVDRRAQEALFAIALSGATGVAGGVAGKVQRNFQAKPPTETEVSKFSEALESKREAIDKAIEKADDKALSKIIDDAATEAIGPETIQTKKLQASIQEGVEAAPAKKVEIEPKAPAVEEGKAIPSPAQGKEKQLPGFGMGTDAEGTVTLQALFENPYGGTVHRAIFQVSDEQAQKYRDAEDLPNKERFAIQKKIQAAAEEQYKAAQAPAVEEGKQPFEMTREEAQGAGIEVVQTSRSEPNPQTAEIAFVGESQLSNGRVYRGVEGTSVISDMLSKQQIESNSETAERLDKSEHIGQIFVTPNPSIATSYVHNNGFVVELDANLVSDQVGRGAGEISTDQPIPIGAVKRVLRVWREGGQTYAADVTSEVISQAKPTPQAPAKAKPTKERDILGGVEPIFQINKALKDAVEIRPKVEKERKAELRRRVGAAAGAMKSALGKRVISAEEAIGRSKGLLKGPLSNARFSSIRDVMEDAMPGAVDTAFRSIGESTELRTFEIFETEEAFAKLIDGIPITLRQVDMIKKHFGLEMGAIAKDRAEISSFGDRMWNLWRAGLLTGLKTSGLNIASTFTHSMMEIETDLIGVPTDIITSLFTGKRTVGWALTGDAKSYLEGAKKGWDYFWTGASERDIGKKFDYVPINFGNSNKGKVQQVYVGSIFRLMGAQDQPFFYGAMSRSIKSQAIAEAANQKLKGQAKKDFIAKRRLAPSGEMLENATHDAEMAVFQNRTMLGDIASHIQKAPGIRWTVPFSRTPSAVAMQIINYSPVGAFKEVFNQVSKGEFSQRNFVRAVGRSAVSIPVMATGALLFAKGLMTLSYPTSERERKQWELEGKKPFAIKIGDKWRSAFVLGPAGNVLIIGAYFQKAFTESGSPSEAIVTAMAGGGKSFTEQTFVVGMSKAIDAIKDPDRSFDRFFTSMAGSFVPTIVADIARATDYGERTYKGPWQGIVNRVPVARQTLEERLDVFGQALPRYGGNPLEVMIDASRPVKIRPDVVVDELKRLWDNDVRVTPTQLGNRDGYKSLTQKENVLLWRRSGEAIYQGMFEMIQRQSYLRKNDEAKGKKIEKLVKDAKDDARAEVASIKLNQGMAMEELKESGLVTNDVEPLIRRRR